MANNDYIDNIESVGRVISRYNADDITCYPSSNAVDEGKLNLEYNMARIVTRLSSKNFCIIKPSYELELRTDDSTGDQTIYVGEGQCSINGMDMIMTSGIVMEPPEEPGHYYLAFHLERDSSGNVHGDLINGVVKTFIGVSLRWFNEKPDPQTDMDMLYLGSVDWDGSTFTNLEEDEDKYGRIWAEDVLGKFMDPKHPDVRRLNLQEFIYKIPDWYLSKEGDTIYGPLIMTDNRQNNNAGIILNVDENGSHITIKDPEVDNDLLYRYGDLNNDGVIDSSDIDLINAYIEGTGTLTDLQKSLADVNHDGIIDEKDITYIQNFINQDGTNPGDTNNIYYINNTNRYNGFMYDVQDGQSKVRMGTAELYENESDKILHLTNNGAMEVDVEGTFNLQADDKITMSTEDTHSPILTLDNTNFNITDPDATNLTFNITYPSNTTIQQTFGKAIWTYDESSQYLTLSGSNISYMDIKPDAIFRKTLRTEDTIYLGTYDDKRTYLKQNEWQIKNTDTDYTKWTSSTLLQLNTTAGNAYIQTKANDNNYSKLDNNGLLELKSTGSGRKILFKDSTAAYDVYIQKAINSKTLNIDSDNLVNSGSITTTAGTVYFKDSTNYLKLDGTTFKTSTNLYVGPSGTASLKAGATTLSSLTVNGNTTINNGTFKVTTPGGGTLTFSDTKVPNGISTTGNLLVSGDISATRVYNSVYNDYAEVFRKLKEEKIEPGDVVCLREDGLVHKVDLGNDLDSIIGICSDTEGVLLGGKDIPEEEQVVVGLVGQIWVKSCDTNIKPGKMVKVVSNGTVEVTYRRTEKFGIAMTEVQNGKVKIVYNG